MWFVAFRHLGPMNEPAFANMLLLVGYLRGSLMAWSIHISPHFFQLKATTYVNPRLRLAKNFTVSGHVEASWADADPCGHFLILLFLCDWIQRNLESFFLTSKLDTTDQKIVDCRSFQFNSVYFGYVSINSYRIDYWSQDRGRDSRNDMIQL